VYKYTLLNTLRRWMLYPSTVNKNSPHATL
jgi:hypothetical protein